MIIAVKFTRVSGTQVSSYSTSRPKMIWKFSIIFLLQQQEKAAKGPENKDPVKLDNKMAWKLRKKCGKLKTNMSVVEGEFQKPKLTFTKWLMRGSRLKAIPTFFDSSYCLFFYVRSNFEKYIVEKGEDFEIKNSQMLTFSWDHERNWFFMFSTFPST